MSVLEAESRRELATANIEVLIGQLVNLVREGKPVRMSKRKGNFVLLTDLVDVLITDPPTTTDPGEPTEDPTAPEPPEPTG